MQYRRGTPWAVLGKSLLVLAGLGTLLLLVASLDGHSHASIRALWDARFAPWANALPVLLLMLALLGLTRRLMLSTWLALLMATLLYAISAVKAGVLEAPLTRQDFLLAGQFGRDGGLLLRYLPWDMHMTFVLTATAMVTLMLAAWEPPLLARTWRLRLPLSVAMLALLASLVAGMLPWQTVYARSRMHYRPWSPATVNARRCGLLGGLLMSNLYAPSAASLAADTAPGRALFRAQRQALARSMRQGDARTRPDIVVVQSESFFDPALLKGYRAQDWISHYRHLATLGQHGRLEVPTYGGGTIRTEFEVLTGLPLRYFPQLDYPYLGLDSQHIPGLVAALKHAGYRTLAIHPNDGGFWNRASVFRRMGFDRFIDKQDPAFAAAPRQGYYIADRRLTDVVLEALRNEGPPQFVFAISMENHGPYLHAPIADDRVAARDAMPVPEGVGPVGARKLRNYLLHQRDADRELGRLAKALAARERPSLLVFYGDHLPGLTESWAGGFKNGREATRQTVPWLLIQPGTSAPQRARDLPAWMLGAEILARAGLHHDAWFALERILEPQLRDEDWKPEPRQARQLASLAQLRLHDDLPPVATAAPGPRQARR